MSNLRHTGPYVGNQMFRDLASQNFKFCFGCNQHREVRNGRFLGALKRFHCAECVVEKQARRLKELTK